jgi:Zn-dependent peptidase ImmA (M78 family)
VISEDAKIGIEKAAEARGLLGLSDTPLEDILRTVEQQTDAEVFVSRLGEDAIAGAFLTSRDVPFLLVNGSHPVVRQRFTLAHEYGHFFLGHGAVYDVKLDWSTRNPKEIQANFFAGAFLAPGAGIERWLASHGYPEMTLETLVSLSSAFGMSAEAMRIRLDTMERLGRSASARLKQQIADKEHWGLAAQLGLEPMEDSLQHLWRTETEHVPPAMFRDALIAIDRALVAPKRAATLLGLDESEIDRRRSDLVASVGDETL